MMDEYLIYLNEKYLEESAENKYLEGGIFLGYLFLDKNSK